MAERYEDRGILYPAMLPTFHRAPAPSRVSDFVRWFWIPRWNLPPGKTARQEILPFPASNLVVMPEGVTLTGPTTGASHRELRGAGWAVGALLRPAGLASLHTDPSALQNREIPIDAPELRNAVTAVMRHGDEQLGRERVVVLFSEWVGEHLGSPPDGALQANAMEDLIASDAHIVSVGQLAERLHLSIRGVQRLAQRYVGVSPLTMIRRYRLQEAAQRLREEPTLTIAQVAADLGYADHAHLTSDFRRVLGLTPNLYRQNPNSNAAEG